eukprot:4293926-Pyramimonas_sp.AAC.1
MPARPGRSSGAAPRGPGGPGGPGKKGAHGFQNLIPPLSTSILSGIHGPIASDIQGAHGARGPL